MSHLSRADGILKREKYKDLRIQGNVIRRLFHLSDVNVPWILNVVLFSPQPHQDTNRFLLIRIVWLWLRIPFCSHPRTVENLLLAQRVAKAFGPISSREPPFGQ